MELSLQLAGILGPVLIALSATEFKNFRIWQEIHPTVVYLNGLVLFSAGIVVVRLHSRWDPDWTLLITAIGWALTLLGLYRMISPAGKQIEKPQTANPVLLVMFLTGVFLTVRAYLPLA